VTNRQRLCHGNSRFFHLLAFALFVALLGAAQSQSHERTFHVSKTELENTLRAIQAYNTAKLPILEGFVTADSLDRYRQPYYQYTLDLTSIASDETILRVTAKVTAWYTDADPSRSGYRTIPSNGRLESDLFERLDETLSGKTTAADAPAPGNSNPQFSREPSPKASSTVLPESASASKAGSVFRSPQSAPAPIAEPVTSVPDKNSFADKRLQQLRQTAKDLEEMLQNQSRPDNLAVVKDRRTPVLSRPLSGARVLLLADVEDEFQVLGTQGDWVHVQVTALLRGWIRRSQLDLSAVAPRVLAPANSAASPGSATFQQTREETATFPGDWEPLRGKKVRIIWVQSEENRKDTGIDKRESFATSLFRKAYKELSHSSDKLEGVVIVFDAADGGMAAATNASLERLSTGQLRDAAFWKQCWLDPPEAFKKSP
jgi:hypothetical protein